MGKILKDTFTILNRHLWLLFLFMMLSYIGLIYFGMVKSSAHSVAQLVIGALTLLFIVVASVAGFFNSLRNTVDSEYIEHDNSKFDLLKTFPKGVADYFLTSFGVIVLYFVLSSAMFALGIMIGKNLIGSFSFSATDFANAFGSMDALMEFQKRMTQDDYVKLSQWHLLYVTLSSILTYLLLYWLPETFYNTKNPVLSLFRAVKKAILHPLKTIQLFVLIVIINLISSVIMALMLPVSALMFLVYFVYFYALLFIMLLMFNFYRYNFVEDKPVVIVISDENLKEELAKLAEKKEETNTPEDKSENDQEE